MPHRKPRLLSILSLAGLACLGVLVGPLFAESLDPGEPFPELVFPALEDGAPMSVADFRGRKLMLHIWASW